MISDSRSQGNLALAFTVRALRYKAGIAQETLALKAGLDRTYMSALERGIYSPTLETIFKILPSLGVTFTQFASALEKERSKMKI
jgi:transcriptional regulator with XRE-family HTH domain